MRAVIYTRVSTDQQAASGLGLEAQLAACRAHTARKGYAVAGEYSDPAMSGKDTLERRPGLQSVVKCAARRSDVVVVVYSLSRLSRRQSLTWALLDDRGEYRLQIESASEPFDTTSPIGRAMLGMLAVWAQLEADMVSERTTAALAARRARGERLGARSLVDASPDVAARVVAASAGGRVAAAAVAAQLNAAGVPAARGGRWHATTVRRVLRAMCAVSGATPRGSHESERGG